MEYKIIVNENNIFPLFKWDASLFHQIQELHIASDNLTVIRNAFETIESIRILDQSDQEIASFTQFSGFGSISYLGYNYSSQLQRYENDLAITLTKVDLYSIIDQMNSQLNPVIDVNAMTLEEYKNYKIKEFSKKGEQLIFAGTDVVLLNGQTKNFTYNLEDQSNLLNALFTIQALDNLTVTLPYHGHGEPCELYSALDIIIVYLTLQVYSTTIQTLVNMRNNWVRSCVTKEEVAQITFETELPMEWQERARSILDPSMTLVEELRRKYFPESGE